MKINKIIHTTAKRLLLAATLVVAIRNEPAVRMRIPTFVLASILGLLLARPASAQGTVYLSTLGQASGINTVIGSDSWRAVGFVSGTNQAGYQLDSVQLLMGPATAGASGFRAMLYTATGVMPGNNLGSLIGSDPFSTGLYGFAASNIALTPSTQYFVVLTAETSLADGTYAWSIQSGFHNNASDGWRLSGDYLASTGGSDWAGYRPNPFQFAISASPIPEPTAVAMVGVGLLAWLLCSNLGQCCHAASAAAPAAKAKHAPPT